MRRLYVPFCNTLLLHGRFRESWCIGFLWNRRMFCEVQFYLKEAAKLFAEDCLKRIFCTQHDFSLILTKKSVQFLHHFDVNSQRNTSRGIERTYKSILGRNYSTIRTPQLSVIKSSFDKKNEVRIKNVPSFQSLLNPLLHTAIQTHGGS